MVHSMKSLLIILFTVCGISSFCQKVVDYNMSSCDKSVDTDYLKNRLVNLERIADTTVIKIGLVENCELIPQFNLSLSQDTLYISITNTSDLFAACSCCFEFEIKAVGIEDTNFTLIHKYQTTEVADYGFREVEKEEVLEIDDNKFIFPSLTELNPISEHNQFTSDSSKVGIWYKYFDESDKVEQKSFYYIDEEGNSKPKWFVTFNEQNEILKVCVSVKKGILTYNDCVTGEEYLQMMKNEP